MMRRSEQVLFQVAVEKRFRVMMLLIMGAKNLERRGGWRANIEESVGRRAFGVTFASPTPPPDEVRSCSVCGVKNTMGDRNTAVAQRNDKNEGEGGRTSID